MIFENASSNLAPYNAMLIVSHPKSVNGSNNGNDNTGNKDPFECAFEMIAAIAVMHADIPKLEIKIIVQNNS